VSSSRPAARKQAPDAAGRTVSLVTLGCARNEVDSEELAARLEAAGWTVSDDGNADVVMVNTCGFIQAAKQESIDELLDAGSGGAKVVAAGCLAERYGSELAEALPEAQVIGFDDYGDIASRLDAVLAGERWPAHEPGDRRRLLPVSPAGRPGAAGGHHLPGHGTVPPDLPPGIAPASGPRVLRRRLDGGPVAPLKIASGCDRRCSFCAIPAFRGAFVSRPPQDLLAEASWLAEQGVRELFLVSENSTSYGKDLGNLRLLEAVLPELAALPGIDRVRVSYLQPAELRPGLIEIMTSTPGVVPYFDLSFQHASGRVLRSMRRFGDRERFCGLLEQIRQASPEAGVRSNFIVGFPGETDDDVAELHRFLTDARLDAIGIFGYSEEDGTEAASLPGQLPDDEIARRVGDLAGLADELMAQRAEERVGESVEVLIEESLGRDRYSGRAAHQAPEVDGTTQVRARGRLAVGDMVRARVSGAEGADLLAEVSDSASAGSPGGGAAGARAARGTRRVEPA
jgi:ribosomal protein S12 methylthiotransferase